MEEAESRRDVEEKKENKSRAKVLATCSADTQRRSIPPWLMPHPALALAMPLYWVPGPVNQCAHQIRRKTSPWQASSLMFPGSHKEPKGRSR